MSKSEHSTTRNTQELSPEGTYLLARQRVHAAQRASSALGELSMFSLATAVSLGGLWLATGDEHFGIVAGVIAIIGLIAFAARSLLASKKKLATLDLAALSAERGLTASEAARSHVESGSSEQDQLESPDPHRESATEPEHRDPHEDQHKSQA